MQSQINTLEAFSCVSKEVFASQYAELQANEERNLCLLALNELEKSVLKGDYDTFKKLLDVIERICDVETPAKFKSYYCDTDNSLKDTNLIILACKHNKVEILKHVLGSFNILYNLSTITGKDGIAPDDEDEMCHNSFYYAIRSDNVALLETLINEWPDDYFAIYLTELDVILSSAYEELKLKNILLSHEIEIFVEDKLLNLCFFSSTSEQVQSAVYDINTIQERVELVLENVGLLVSEYYSNEKEIDEKCLYISKFVSHNIHILKWQLRSTYTKLPWEEMEFCLIFFILSNMKQQEINLFVHAILRKDKIIDHLKNFTNQLAEINIFDGVSVLKLSRLPRLNRDKVREEVVKNNPEFEDLYNDYQQIRDVHSLQKISDSINLALASAFDGKECQLIIIRTLQVIGEYLKNTKESPNLSSIKSELLLLSLQKDTRDILTQLRDSLSHADSLAKRIEIEENMDLDFINGIQNDLKKVSSVISDILFNSKIKMIRMLLKNIIYSENLDEIKDIAKILSHVEFEDMIRCGSEMQEHIKLEKCIAKLNNIVSDKTYYEQGLFDQINSIIISTKTKEDNFMVNYTTAISSLKGLDHTFNYYKIKNYDIRAIKHSAKITLNNITSKIDSCNLKEIALLSEKIFNCARSRIKDDLDEVSRIILEIYFVAELSLTSIKWIKELEGKLKIKPYGLRTSNQNETDKPTEDKFDNMLKIRISDLEKILNKNALNNESKDFLIFYKNNKQLQAVVEMLVLDIMSILEESKLYRLANNIFFLDDSNPLLNGRYLRNHLAHYNDLVDLLLSDTSTAVLLNAKKLTSENIVGNKKIFGRSVSNNPYKLRYKHYKGLATIENQRKMFIALQEGNLTALKICLKNGADINERNIHSWTTLHFASKGDSLDIVKLIFNHNSKLKVKNSDGQSPLHIAAAHGKQHIVEYFVNTVGMYVDDTDLNGKTSLHLAALHGHKDTVATLLQNKANTAAQDISGTSPLHYSVRNDHIDVAKILLEIEIDVDIHQVAGGFTALHVAAERGNLELVDFLLQNGANVNSKNDRDWTALHGAILNGHLDVGNTLISKGADVNARLIDGCTPLHHAVENGNQMLVDALLNCGLSVDVNASAKCDGTTPLHHATKYGYEGIVKNLLKNKANANASTVEGKTPLHFAAQNGYLGIVSTLLEQHIDVNAKDVSGYTALHYAAGSCFRSIIDLLIKHSALIDIKDNKGFTALHLAAFKNQKDITEQLINYNAKINDKSNAGETPLHVAAKTGSRNVIDILINNNAEVNPRDNIGSTPLHSAAIRCDEATISFLIENNADVNAYNFLNITPLHIAAATDNRSKYAINIIISKTTQVNAKDSVGNTPLHIAVQANFKEAVEMLVLNGADINTKDMKNRTPLYYAVRMNNKDIVEILISNKLDIDVGNSEYLLLAVISGYTDIVHIFLEQKFCVESKCEENATLLHIAAKRGFKEIVNALIQNKSDVDALNVRNETPLFLAAEEGNQDVVQFLIANKASVFIKNHEGLTPLHVAASLGHNNVVKVLLHNEADFNVRDAKDRTAIEVAVLSGHLQIVKTLLKCKDIDIRCSDDVTLLHVAAQKNNMDIIQHLLNEGFDIHSTDSRGSKPIHIAAREGFKDIVEYLFNNGSSIKDVDKTNQTILHYAVISGKLKLIEYLITKGVDVNAKDGRGATPMHIAAHFGNKDAILVLLTYGATYNDSDEYNVKPLNSTNDKDVINLLVSTKKLFEAVRHSSLSEVENSIAEGAFVNTKSSDNETPLQYAARKGDFAIVSVLLRERADPNAVGAKKWTPLHYAAKFSHLNVVKSLLCYGAMYNPVSDSGKTPLDLTTDQSVAALLKFVDEAFENVKKCRSKVVNSLKVKDFDSVKAAMNACDRERKTLVVVAILNNFPNVEQLKEILQKGVLYKINTALNLFGQDKYQGSLRILKDVYEQRKEILGPDNPGTLDIEIYMAKVLYKQGKYENVLNLLGVILQKQIKMFGLYNNNVLSTRSLIALVLHKQGQNGEALNIFQEVYNLQNEKLGPNHTDTLDTQHYMALVLDKLQKYDEALSMNEEVYKKRFEIDPTYALLSLNNKAMVLSNQGKYDEALTVYETVLKRKRISFGANHSNTLRTLHHIARLLFNQKKYHDSLKAYKELIIIQENFLGRNHPDTLETLHDMANTLFEQFKWIAALKAYEKVLYRIKALWGSNHPDVLDILYKIDVIHSRFKLDGMEKSDTLRHLQTDIIVASNNGDMLTVQNLLKNGADVHVEDADGRTPLHFAVNNGHMDIVSVLLENGGDVTRVTNKGNTPLHTATSKGYKEIIRLLLHHVDRCKLNDFVNARTTVGGNASLHVAAKNGSFDIVLSLLEHGAVHNIKNKEDKMPIELSKDQNVSNLLKLVEELFQHAEQGNIQIMDMLRSVKHVEILAITNVRNDQGHTLMQVSINNKHKKIAIELLKFLKDRLKLTNN